MATTLLLLFVVCIHAVSAACPQGWIDNSVVNSCYLIGLQQLTWIEALHACQRQGATLVKVDTPEESIILKQRLAAYHPSPEVQVWLGGTDSDAEGRWQWVGSHQMLDFTDWYPGEPNSYSFGDEDCMTMYTRYNFQWNDEYCDKALPYICERSP